MAEVVPHGHSSTHPMALGYEGGTIGADPLWTPFGLRWSTHPDVLNGWPNTDFIDYVSFDYESDVSQTYIDTRTEGCLLTGRGRVRIRLYDIYLGVYLYSAWSAVFDIPGFDIGILCTIPTTNGRTYVGEIKVESDEPGLLDSGWMLFQAGFVAGGGSVLEIPHEPE